MSFTLGSVQIDDPVFLAPMSGVTDLPFRRLVRKFGAGLVFSEMLASRPMVDPTALRALAEIQPGRAQLRAAGEWLVVIALAWAGERLLPFWLYPLVALLIALELVAHSRLPPEDPDRGQCRWGEHRLG